MMIKQMLRKKTSTEQLHPLYPRRICKEKKLLQTLHGEMDSVMRIGHWSGLEQHPQVVGSFLEIGTLRCPISGVL
ncbi:hypothetical protein MTR_2g039560 [Medicago truncatula]|uniref:Uncharacterized protein n=1 Tax=Medicago truncatula TaxID=3880 RepID=G7IIK5_MEDTR|nr:hypothetical protein MTR_2g039560 [Medicago truncatula]